MPTKIVPVMGVKAGADDGLVDGQFEAIVSVFGNVDAIGDRVLLGAFKDTLAEWEASGNPIPVLWSHRWEDPDFHIGFALDAKELGPGDPILPPKLKNNGGLWIHGQLDLDDAKSAKVYKLLKGRRVTQFSFAYDIDDAAMVTEDGEQIYDLVKLKLHEVGPCLLGCNQETDLLGVKGLADLASRVKAGRVLSGKNEKELRTAHEAISRVLSALDEQNDDDGKSGAPGAKDEDLSGGKSKEHTDSSPADLSELDAIELDIQLSA